MTKDEAPASPKDAALKLALEALESDHPDIQLRAQITLRAVLAQPPLPVQPVQPVSWTGNGSAEWREINAPTGFFYQVDKRLEEDDDTQVYKKPWVNLTDEEVIEISHLALSRVQAVLMAAAKLKEKNT
jgi:hypothetical protein